MQAPLRLCLIALSACTIVCVSSSKAESSDASAAVHRLAARYDTFAKVPNDPRGRIVYGTSRGRLHVLELQRGLYREIWVSPSLVTRIREVCIADLNGDGRYAIIAYNTRGYMYVFSLNDFSMIWQAPEMQFQSIEAITVAQVDRDPQKEILFLSSGVLYIYDGKDFFEEWRSGDIYEATDVVAGDVDGDGDIEIVLSTGQVLDAWSHAVEWESPDPFGDHIELADIDGDGRLEVVASSGETAIIFDIDERREKWD
jgi:hypothetical protein